MLDRPKYCLRCFLDRNQRVDATHVIDGDPLCAACARQAAADGLGCAEPIVVNQQPAESRKENEVMATDPVKHHKRESTRTCSCGCGELVFGRWPYLKGHNKPAVHSGQHKSPKAKRLVPVQLDKPVIRAEPNVKANGHDHYTIALNVTPDWLDRAWARLTPDLKAVAIAAALES